MISILQKWQTNFKKKDPKGKYCWTAMYDRAAKVQMCSKSNKFQESFLNSSFTFFFSFFLLALFVCLYTLMRQMDAHHLQL